MIGPNTDSAGKKLPHILNGGDGDIVDAALRESMSRLMNALQGGNLAGAVEAMKDFISLIDRD